MAPAGSNKQPPLNNQVQACLHVGGVTLFTWVGVRLLSRAVRALLSCGKGSTPSLTRQQQGQQSATAAASAQNLGNEDGWRVVPKPPPRIPKDYKEVARADLPYSVQEFYARVVSGESGFMERLHTQVEKQWDWLCRGWRSAPASTSAYPYSDDKSFLQGGSLQKSVFEFVTGGTTSGLGGFVRTISFTQPKKPPAPVDARCVQRQQYVVYQGDVLVFATAMNMLNTPFNDSFMVNTLWEVRPTSPTTCTAAIHLKVHFLKGVLVAPLIRSTTFRDTTEFYKKFLSHAVELGAGGGGTTGQASSRAAQTAAPATSTGSAGGGVSSVSLSRQLRVLAVLALLIGGLLHQWFLRSDLHNLKLQVSTLATLVAAQMQ